METATTRRMHVTDEIWNEFGSNLKHFIAARINDSDAVKDILQEVFIKIHMNIGKLKDNEKLAPWLYAIARNAITDHYRKSRNFTDIDKINLEGDAASPEPKEKEDVIACLRPFTVPLPEIYKEALIMVDLRQIPQNRYAEMKGLGYSAAKARVRRAREMVKEQLTECCAIYYDKYGNIIDCEEKHPGKPGCDDNTGTPSR
jgi:RNA polymerase sigma-70 factor, ECF subfamily